MKLEIVTPEKRMLDAEVDSVTVPTASGEAGIMPNHAPLVSVLKPGILSYNIKGATDRVAVSGGFVEVNSDNVSVLVDSAETADEIDADRARSDRDEAERAIAAAAMSPVDDVAGLRELSDHAAARLQLAGGR